MIAQHFTIALSSLTWWKQVRLSLTVLFKLLTDQQGLCVKIYFVHTIIKLIAQPDDLCHCCLDFCDDHLSQLPDNRDTWYTVPCTRYSNVLFDHHNTMYHVQGTRYSNTIHHTTSQGGSSVVLDTVYFDYMSIIVIIMIKIIMGIIFTSQAGSSAGRSHAPRSPQGLLSRSASPGFKEF